MRDLSSIAEQLRSKGRSGDTILAHINPSEAELLRGGKKQSVNPHTGLPEFRGGLLHSFARAFLNKPSHKVTRKMKAEGTYRKPRLGNWLAASLPLIAGPLGAGLGGMLPGFMSKFGTVLPSGLGGGLAGLLGNSLQGKRSILKQSPGMAFMGGAGKGMASSAITNEMANFLNLDPYSGFGKTIGMREPFFKGMRSTLAPELAEEGANAASGGMGDFSKILGALPGAGSKGAATQVGSAEDDAFHGEPSYMTEHGMTPGGAGRDAMSHFGKARPAAPSEGGATETGDFNSPYTHSQLLEMLMKMLREHPEQRDQIMEEINKIHGGAKRLKAGGYVCGKSGGQTDDRPAQLPVGSYVANATVTSLLGDGNSNHGAEKLKEFENKVLRESNFVSGERGNWTPTRKVNALISDGEYVMKKEVVSALGKGDNKKGAKILDKAFKNVLSHKGVKSILPPKTKPIERYIGRI